MPNWNGNSWSINDIHYLELDVGCLYRVSYFNKEYNIRFIKVTPQGYNFLRLDTYECLLKQHVFPGKSKKFPIKKTFQIIGSNYSDVNKMKKSAEKQPTDYTADLKEKVKNFRLFTPMDTSELLKDINLTAAEEIAFRNRLEAWKKKQKAAFEKDASRTIKNIDNILKDAEFEFTE